MEVAQRTVFRLREAQEGLDFVGHALHGLADLAHRPSDAADDSVDDVSSPLKSFPRQALYPVNSCGESVHDGILDAGHLLGDDVPRRLKDAAEYLSQLAPDSANDIPGAADYGSNHLPYRSGDVFDGVPRPLPVAGEDTGKEIDDACDVVQKRLNERNQRVPDDTEY